ncbi:MAG: glycoside hydrolase family 130 protein, partial [Isosphaeraceae bacterium]
DIRFLPVTELEEYGVEDPRITPLYGRYYFTYVAVSRHGAATALASTPDFLDFSRQGTIFCCENKDVVLFPDWIDGAHAALHRPNPATPFCRPEMWIAWSQDIIHWGHHGVLHGGGADWETGRVGAGTPPIRVPGGWLEIYHGSRHTTTPGAVGKYSTGALLLHPENPARILRRTPDSIFEPTAEFERSGFVPDVVFPTGIVETEDTFLVYYGAADTCTAVVEFAREELMATLIAL